MSASRWQVKLTRHRDAKIILDICDKYRWTKKSSESWHLLLDLGDPHQAPCLEDFERFTWLLHQQKPDDEACALSVITNRIYWNGCLKFQTPFEIDLTSRVIHNQNPFLSALSHLEYIQPRRGIPGTYVFKLFPKAVLNDVGFTCLDEWLDFGWPNTEVVLHGSILTGYQWRCLNRSICFILDGLTWKLKCTVAARANTVFIEPVDDTQRLRLGALYFHFGHESDWRTAVGDRIEDIVLKTDCLHISSHAQDREDELKLVQAFHNLGIRLRLVTPKRSYFVVINDSNSIDVDPPCPEVLMTVASPLIFVASFPSQSKRAALAAKTNKEQLNLRKALYVLRYASSQIENELKSYKALICELESLHQPPCDRNNTTS